MSVDYTSRFMFGIEVDSVPESLDDGDGWVHDDYLDGVDGVMVLSDNGYDCNSWFLVLTDHYFESRLGYTEIVEPEKLVTTQDMIDKFKKWLVDHDIEVTEPGWMLSCYQW